MDFILASASTARKQLLAQAGIEAIAVKSGFDESLVQLSDPVDLVNTLARCKAEQVIPRYPQALVLGCDSVLAVGGEIHGKPADREEAIARWQQMRGQVGQLYTGHALFDTATGKSVIRCGITGVKFAPISDQIIAAYVDTGEPMNCAGCFAIDGQGGLFVERLEGCHSNVIGLSLPLRHEMLNELGHSIVEFWQHQNP